VWRIRGIGASSGIQGGILIAGSSSAQADMFSNIVIQNLWILGVMLGSDYVTISWTVFDFTTAAASNIATLIGYSDSEEPMIPVGSM
jgi:hypothetical protein